MFLHFRFVALILVIASPVFMAGTSSAIAQAGAKKSRAAKDPTVVPRNYRRLITRYFASKDAGSDKIQKAQISRPGLWQNPLGFTEPAPIICVKWTVQGSFGPDDAMLIFRFRNGQIYETLNPESVRSAAGAFGVKALKSVTCDRLSYGPYPELAKLKRPNR